MELTDKEKMALEVFVNDAFLFETVNSLFKKYIDERRKELLLMTTVTLRGMTNEEVGEKFRACAEATDLINHMIYDLQSYKTPTTQAAVKNPGR